MWALIYNLVRLLLMK